MSILLLVCLLVVFAACVGFLYNEGMWSNGIRLINVITSALLAMNFFEPLARWLTGMNETMKTYVVVWDYLALWALFSAFLLVLHLAASQISRVKVRFLKIVDRIGGGFFAVWIGWVMVCFTLATFHAAPLARDFMFGGFNPDNKMFLGFLAPDREWLAFTKKMSDGTFCHSEPTVFGVVGGKEFISGHAEKRKSLDQYVTVAHSIRVNPDYVKLAPNTP